jgi:hypothetical protein
MYPIAFDVLDASSVLTHAASVTLTVTLPDGTTATPTITDSVTGQYRLAYQTTIPGRYTAHAVTTSPVTSWDDEFDAAPTPWPAMVSLADAKGQLNMDVTDHRFDDELRDFIASATGAAEQYKHEVIVRRAVTDTLDLSSQGGYGYGYGYGRLQQRFWLRSVPVISLTSVVAWDGSVTWDVTQMRAAPSGLVRVMAGPRITGLADIAHIAGYQVIPAHYKRGALVILQHLWETQRGPGTAASGVIGSEEHWRQPGEFFSVPDKAKELFGPPRPVMA